MKAAWALAKRHWKKAAAVSVAAYASNYAARRYRTTQGRAIMQTEAAAIGEQPQEPLEPVRKVLVVVDVLSGDRGARELFAADVAPILHLAGIMVEVVETRDRGQAKDTARQLDLKGTDGVLVVGGDGTVQEFVTGWMRRDDIGTVGRQVPLGIVPVGDHNTASSALLGPSPTLSLRLGRAALAVARGTTRHIDLLSIANPAGQTVHAVGYMAWGLPAALIADTFNPYSRFSRARAKFAALKSVFSNGGTPQYRAELTLMRDGQTVSRHVVFSALTVASTETCRGLVVAPGRAIDDGLVSISLVKGPLTALELFQKWRALGAGATLASAFAVPAEEMAVVQEFKVVPAEEPAPPAAEHTDSDTGGSAVSAGVPLNIDGEVFDSFPVHVKVLHKKLLVYAWRPASPDTLRPAERLAWVQ